MTEQIPQSKIRSRLDVLRRLRDRWQQHAEEAERRGQNAGFVRAEASALTWAVEFIEERLAVKDDHENAD